MNASFHDPSNPPRPPASPREPASGPTPRREADAPQRHLHRARDFGIGYGNSSGYGSELHYVDGHADPIFRCV
jgi:hypothetical protein